MSDQTITLIAALDKNYAIGKGNTMPWHLPDDLKRFKALTTEKTVLMGRKTFESIGKPLPKRRNVVLTRSEEFTAGGVEVVHSVEEALKLPDLFVIGGGEIYTAFLPHATHMNLTLVDTAIESADAYFPRFDAEDWLIARTEDHATDEAHPFAFKFVDFVWFG